MRNVIVTLMLMISINVFADKQLVDTKWHNLLKEESKIEYNDVSKYPKYLVGETVYFDGVGAFYSNGERGFQCFYNFNPDTIWVKKPKGSPQINKDYYLMPFYHGVGKFSEKSYRDDRYTPITEILETPFRIDSVSDELKEEDSHFTYCEIYLTNLISNENLIYVSSNNIQDEITIFSETLGEKIMPLNTKLYENTGSYYSPKPKDFIQYSVEKVTYECKVTRTKYTPKLVLELRDKKDELTSYDYTYKDHQYSFASKNLISKADYEELVDKDKISEINSLTDKKAVHHKFPFTFSFILGETTGSELVYQKLGGESSYYLNSYRDLLNKNSNILIADTKTIKGKDYYVATCWGKCFFIPVGSVSFKPEEQAKLDSLMRCSQEIRDNFVEATKCMEIYRNGKYFQETMKEMDSFEKYGLSIVNWKVYDESEYTDGTGLNFTFYNPSKSTIKYITITFLGYNAVDDPVGRTMTRKCIGPIESKQLGEYNFEYVWFTDIVEYAKIKSIRVDYKNGTSKTITNINKIEWSDELYDLVFNPPLKDLKDLYLNDLDEE